MARKSKIEPVREFLEEAKKQTYEKMKVACSNMDFPRAEAYNRFSEDVLTPAIKLCGEEKPKTVQIKGKGSCDPFNKEG